MVYILSRQPDRYPKITVKDPLHKDAHWSYRVKGLPVPADLIPPTVSVMSEFAMPEILEWTKSHFIVSRQVKAFFQLLVPGGIQYIPIEIDAPHQIKLSLDYFYINVTTHAQYINWSMTTLDQREWRRDSAGRPIVYAPPPPEPGHVEFLEMPKYLIWHEAPRETTDAVYQYFPANHLLSNDLWIALNDRFPSTIDPRLIG